MTHIGKRLYDYRVRHNLSGTRTAHMLGVRAGTLAMWEGGKEPGVASKRKIEQWLRDEQANQPPSAARYKARVDALEDALKDVDEALYWLLNLVHGNSKGGPDYSPPSAAEWIEAVEAGKVAHEKAKKMRTANAPED